MEEKTALDRRESECKPTAAVQPLCQHFQMSTYEITDEAPPTSWHHRDTGLRDNPLFKQFANLSIHRTHWWTTKVNIHSRSGCMGLWWKEASQRRKRKPRRGNLPLKVSCDYEVEPGPDSFLPSGGPQAHLALPLHEIWHWETWECVPLRRSVAPGVWEPQQIWPWPLQNSGHLWLPPHAGTVNTRLRFRISC